MTIDELTEILDQFLDRWTIENINNMTLEQYVSIGDKDTFCQWIETKTRMLGSIKGLTSIKFGIYERNDSNKKLKNYKNDDTHSWLKGYGENKNIAFENIKKDIIRIINLSGIGRFDLIDNILLPDLFKWKIAFLYSNERLVPIYKKSVLYKIARYFGLQTTRMVKISEIQNIMIINKPANLNVYQFMWQLYKEFGDSKDSKQVIEPKSKKELRTTRKASAERNTQAQIRTIARSYIAEQKHNKIQETLKKLLIEEYGQDNVILEENFVDIKLIQPNYISFYEVKAAPYASQCIKEALGQILLYSFNDSDKRIKKHVVVGQYAPTDNDKKYIEFLQNNLLLEFEYLNIELK